MTRRRGWMAAAVAAVLVIAAGLWVWLSSTRTPSAEDATAAYLHALESGDPDSVEATGADATARALTAFGAATSLIEDARVEDVRRDGDTATADVTFRLGGQAHDARLTLTFDEGRWIVGRSGLGTITPTTTLGSAVAIGDTPLPTGEASALLPASYTLAAAPDAFLSGEAEVTVLPGTADEVTIDAALRAEATTAAQRQLDEYAATCTQSAPAPPESCGIRIPWGTDFSAVTGIRYRIEQTPVIALTPSGFSADGGVLVATVTGTGQDGAARTTTYRTESWSIRGDVTFLVDDITLTAW